MLFSYLVVCASGAAILALEIVGTRVLGPFYGVSLFLWSALITVTLASLSVGYAIGGRLADRGPRVTVLARVFLATGAWVVLVPWLRSPLLDLTAGLGLRAAVLLAATVLFAPPLTLLGMVSPYVIRMSVREVGEVGRRAGDLFAVSTVASVVAALATGFWLIPNLGVTRLLLTIGAGLLLVGALCFWRARSRTASATCLLLLGASSWAAPQSHHPGSDVLFETDSPYCEVLVLDRTEGRYLLLDGGVHTIASADDAESLHEYEPVMLSAELFFDRPGRTLLLGLGGGLLARDYLERGWTVDAVEIDPTVVHVARQYFGLPRSERLRVFTMDARRYLNQCDEEYDLVLVDVFGSSSIPFHLASAEMFAQVAARLRPQGLLVMNCEARRWRDPLVDHLAAGLAASFAEVWAMPTQEPPNTLGNVVLLAAPQPGLVWPEERLPRPAEYLANPTEHWRVVQMNHAWDNRFVPDLGVAAWTDDRSRVDLESEEINRIARRQLREFFAQSRTE